MKRAVVLLTKALRRGPFAYARSVQETDTNFATSLISISVGLHLPQLLWYSFHTCSSSFGFRVYLLARHWQLSFHLVATPCPSAQAAIFVLLFTQMDHAGIRMQFQF